MHAQIIYSSRTGKTKIIADAIAEELGVIAQEVGSATIEDGTMIFLGSGCYGRKPGKDMIQFIEANDFAARPIALFGTSAGGKGQEVSEMESLLRAKNAQIKGTFHCKGSFLWIFSRGTPSTDDIGQAKAFARSMSESIE